jgi:predicted dehydrogenase
MTSNEPDKTPADYNRREFIRGTTSFGAMMLLMGGVPLQAEDKPDSAPGATAYSTVSAPVSCGVIGCGPWGREILQTLARLPNAPVTAVCDNYEVFLRRGKEAAPQAEGFTDYRQLLAKKEVQAVIVATPTHQHREIVEAALAAGKHVYCEAPLATTVEDARAIAQAAKAAVRCNFQAGLQARSDPQRHFLLQFIRSGAMGKNVMARSQWHKKESWRRASPNPDREKVINWRLSRDTSAGLMGEIGIHQLDLISWFLDSRPAAVSGFGGILNWNDGRDVADTVQAVFEYPEGLNFLYDCTLADSFDADYDMMYGTDAAIMMRGSKAWMFKEPDSPLLGWEVYARKDQFYQETGIALVADATKQTALQEKATADAPDTETVLHSAFEAFITNTGVVSAGVEDFTANFGNDTAALRDYLAGLGKARKPAAGYEEGYAATVMAIKANEAIIKGQKLAIEKELFGI